MAYKSIAAARTDRYRISIAGYAAYQRQGYLVVPGLVSREEVEQLLEHAMDILHGRTSVEGIEPPPAGASVQDLVSRFTRVHMLHRVDPLSERYLLHPRVLDVVEALIGPDVLALQTMLFYNPPGLGGQGWHQDAYYITTYPDVLIGAWIALDAADEENGCVWVAPASHAEPVYPDAERGSLTHAEGVFSDLCTISGASHLDDSVNVLSQVAARYPKPVPARLEPGDVLFFHGHILHRSHVNRSLERWRRAFVNHYTNARSWVPWGHGDPGEERGLNGQHILARGATHLPFARPRFGTPCAALGYPAAESEVPAGGASASNPIGVWSRR